MITINRTTFLSLLLAFGLTLPIDAQDSRPITTEDQWDALLKEYVTEGKLDGITLTFIDYKALKNNARFNRLLVTLAETNVPADRKEALAYWINAYNILAVKVVLNEYPVDSIKDAGGFITKVWDIEAGDAGGKTYSLGQIEHEILRKMDEPRIHAAIVCASLSCPDLRPEAFRAEKLDEQLDDQMREFLGNPTKGAGIKNGRLHISKIFSWFEEDFTTGGQTVVDYLRPYLPENIASQAEGSPKYFSYDWSLNDSSRL